MKTIVKNYTYRNDGSRSHRNIKLNKISLKLFKTNDDKQQRKRVKIKSAEKTKIIIQKAKMSKIKDEEEEFICNSMQQLSLKRKCAEPVDESMKRQIERSNKRLKSVEIE